MIKKEGNRTNITTTISKTAKKALIEIAAKEHRSLARQLDYMIERYYKIHNNK